MKLILPFLGRTRAQWIETGIRDYRKRLARYHEVHTPVIRERYPANSSEAVIRRRGSELLLEKWSGRGLLVALDPGGRQFTSEELAGRLGDWRDRGVPAVCFLIGGHVGLDLDLLGSRLDLTWSLSRLTLTHEMSRLLVLEQLYRACTIDAGTKYHR